MLRDTIVAVAGGAVVSLIVALTTSLPRLELIGVFGATLAACAAVLGALALAGTVRNWYRGFRKNLIADVLHEINAVATLETKVQSHGLAGIQAAFIADGHPDDLTELRRLLTDGRKLQAQCLQFGHRNVETPGDLAVEIGGWEGIARATIVVGFPDYFLKDFSSGVSVDIFGLPVGVIHDRMNKQLSALENALRYRIDRVH